LGGGEEVAIFCSPGTVRLYIQPEPSISRQLIDGSVSSQATFRFRSDYPLISR